eukprot:2111954-Rhodomonas_salina.4
MPKSACLSFSRIPCTSWYRRARRQNRAPHSGRGRRAGSPPQADGRMEKASLALLQRSLWCHHVPCQDRAMICWAGRQIVEFTRLHAPKASAMIE